MDGNSRASAKLILLFSLNIYISGWKLARQLVLKTNRGLTGSSEWPKCDKYIYTYIYIYIYIYIAMEYGDCVLCSAWFGYITYHNTRAAEKLTKVSSIIVNDVIWQKGNGIAIQSAKLCRTLSKFMVSIVPADDLVITRGRVTVKWTILYIITMMS